MSLTAGFSHVAILTPNLDRWVAFYSDTFGAALRDISPAHGDHPRMAVVALSPTVALHAFEVPDDLIVGQRAKMGGRGPIDHFAVAATSSQDFNTIRTRLVASGASSGEVNMLGGQPSVFFRDPDGAELELTWAAPT